MPDPVTTTSETGRLEAFSDGVIAIIITIMVLELRPPTLPSLAGLAHLWPVLLAYGLSFVQVGIYWINHHNLLDRASASTTGLRWANMLWLFCLSLIPFGTAWFGEFPSKAVPTAAYLVTLLLPSLAYLWLEKEASCSSDRSEHEAQRHRAQSRKGAVSLILYAIGVALAFVTSAGSIACAMIVSVLWIAPGSRVDRLFGRPPVA
jgi:uncharacterized membrane protein